MTGVGARVQDAENVTAIAMTTASNAPKLALKPFPLMIFGPFQPLLSEKIGCNKEDLLFSTFHNGNNLEAVIASIFVVHLERNDV